MKKIREPLVKEIKALESTKEFQELVVAGKRFERYRIWLMLVIVVLLCMVMITGLILLRSHIGLSYEEGFNKINREPMNLTVTHILLGVVSFLLMLVCYDMLQRVFRYKYREQLRLVKSRIVEIKNEYYMGLRESMNIVGLSKEYGFYAYWSIREYIKDYMIGDMVVVKPVLKWDKKVEYIIMDYDVESKKYLLLNEEEQRSMVVAEEDMVNLFNKLYFLKG